MTQTQTLAILFADVSGSTRLFELRGDVEARRIIAGVLGVMTQIVHQHGGTVIKTIGDEIMCTFPGAVNGVQAACDMQRRVSTDPAFVCDNIGLRIGMHYGGRCLWRCSQHRRAHDHAGQARTDRHHCRGLP
jgi:adenylate cyclase